MGDRHDHAAGRTRRRRRTARILAASAAVAAVVGGCGGSGGGSGSSGPSGATTATAPVPFASTQGEAVGATVDGIRCQQAEQVVYHIHAHLAVFVGGRSATIPEGIGIAPPRSVEQSAAGPFVLAGSCFYWLHSHTDDGVIHIESPTPRTYTLGNYFDLWNQPLGATVVATAKGPVTAYVNGKQFTGDPRSIRLTAHAVIQLDVGSRTAPAAFAFPSGL